jgi:hypothetical protein
MAGCQSKSKETPAASPQQIPVKNKVVNKIIPQKVNNDAAAILSKKEVPILCFHNIKEIRSISYTPPDA